MTMREDYIPQDEPAESVWAQTFKTEAAKAPNSTAMGCDAETVSAVTGAAQDTKIAAAEAVIRPVVASGKQEATYTDAVGKALGVIGPEIGFDAATYQAELRGVKAAGPGLVEVRFGKARGQVQAVRVRMRRAGQPAFTMVGTAMKSPWIDHTPLAVAGQPEVREYQVVAVVADAEVGQPSEIVPVTVSP